MKKIIDGVLYNTETSQEIASDHNRFASGVTDFSHWEETLYESKKGNWFLVGSGGPSSKYSRPCQGGYSGDTDVFTPLTVSEAIEWLERAGETELLLKHFPEDIREG